MGSVHYLQWTYQFRRNRRMSGNKGMKEVCPVCGSSELYYETGGSVGKVYHCKDCNYIGPLIVEADDAMIEAIKEDYERKKSDSD